MIFMFSLCHHIIIYVYIIILCMNFFHLSITVTITQLLISPIWFPLLRWGCWTSTSDRRRRTRCRRGWRTCSRWSCPGSCSWRDLFTPQSKYKYTTHPLPAFDQKLDSFWGQTWTPHRQQSLQCSQRLKVFVSVQDQAWNVRRYSTEFEDLPKPITNATADLLDNNTKATQWVQVFFFQ